MKYVDMLFPLLFVLVAVSPSLSSRRCFFIRTAFGGQNRCFYFFEGAMMREKVMRGNPFASVLPGIDVIYILFGAIDCHSSNQATDG
ncbi:hypothetical protein [Herbaspirillum robiniae]|uniref:hypothetical protein n=1 Tax=Herbaspirillum robiniae TaxID=2014887 RepID=UPI00101AEBD1|nr:hypothetical protein [Herbaspirillum robiniae]